MIKPAVAISGHARCFDCSTQARPALAGKRQGMPGLRQAVFAPVGRRFARLPRIRYIPSQWAEAPSGHRDKGKTACLLWE
jgi:hypothetical protein